tara:strand:+ start:305 stop:505 length:201 start_codon:yes stop_codon:yes gene_type:complete
MNKIASDKIKFKKREILKSKISQVAKALGVSYEEAIHRIVGEIQWINDDKIFLEALESLNSSTLKE